jgi:hypothetical protein
MTGGITGTATINKTVSRIFCLLCYKLIRKCKCTKTPAPWESPDPLRLPERTTPSDEYLAACAWSESNATWKEWHVWDLSPLHLLPGCHAAAEAVQTSSTDLLRATSLPVIAYLYKTPLHTQGHCHYLISSQENIIPCCCDSPLPVACCACNITTTHFTSDPHCAGYTPGRGIWLATILLTAHCLNETSSEPNNVVTEKADNGRVQHSGMWHGAVW